MEVDISAQATPRASSASAVAHPPTEGGSAAPAPSALGGQKMKKCTMSQQGIRDIVAGMLGGQGMSREDWEQSLWTDYRVDPLLLPEWSVSEPLGRHLSAVEGTDAHNPRSPQISCFGS